MLTGAFSNSPGIGSNALCKSRIWSVLNIQSVGGNQFIEIWLAPDSNKSCSIVFSGVLLVFLTFAALGHPLQFRL